MREKIAYFETVYDTYVAQIFRFVYVRTNQKQLAEDITAETFLKFWKVIMKEKQVDNDRALLYVIARGLVIDHYRANHTREITLDKVEEFELMQDDDLLIKTDKKQEIARILGILALLKKEYREIILLRFVDDLEYPEISAILKKPEATIRVLLHRAIRSLKEKL